MKFENEKLDRQMIDRLMSHSIFISKNAPPMNKEKALVLIGEAMLDKFVKEFVSLWKDELFPHCLLRDYEASEEEMREWLGKDEPNTGEKAETVEEDNECSLKKGNAQSCSNNCKGVMKMDENTKEKLDSYLELLGEIKQKTNDERTVVALLQEISKDRRMEQIRQERNFNGDLPATEKQIAFLKNMGATIPENLTRQQASQLIEDTKAAIREMKKTGKVPVRVP